MLEVGVSLGRCVQFGAVLPLLQEHAHPLAAAVSSGDAVVALAATDDVGAGSDLMAMGTVASLTDASVVVSGVKRWITSACHADFALVLARHKPARHFTSFCWVLVPLSSPGVRVAAEPTSLFPGAGIGSIVLDSVELDRSAVVGPPGRGLASFARHVASERRAGALWAVSVCRQVLRDVRGRLAARPLGGGTLWDNAAVRERYARCVVETWRMEVASRSADGMAAAMVLKVVVADGLDFVLRECTQLLGAEAFVDGGVAQLRAAMSMFGVAGGAVGAMLAGVAEHAEELLEGRLAQGSPLPGIPSQPNLLSGSDKIDTAPEPARGGSLGAKSTLVPLDGANVTFGPYDADRGVRTERDVGAARRHGRAFRSQKQAGGSEGESCG